MQLNLKALMGKLTDSSRRALEAAAGSCMSRTHYEVEIEHWLRQLCDTEGGDVHRVLAHFGIEPAQVSAELDATLDAFKSGNGARPNLAGSIEDVVRLGWITASINFGASKARSATLLLGALSDRGLRRRLEGAAPSLAGIGLESFAAQLTEICQGSSEDRELLVDEVGSSAGHGDRRSTTPALDRYTRDLTEDARAGRMDPVLGRESEIRQIIDILTRRRQNNPILTGEAGVGKTAVVEGFAARVAEGTVPEVLRGVQVRTLDLGLLQAGAGVKGEFENRLKQVISEVRSSPTPIILFIDEAHTMIGAGGEAGQNDAANLLKPALARGELRTIAATTWAEYKKFFEKDAALSRRFQVVKIDEPSEAVAIEMMRGLLGPLEEHHGVRILDSGVVDAVRLSSRYIPARQLPDNSMSVLDPACARVAIGQADLPAELEALRRCLDASATELRILEREQVVGADHKARIETLASERSEVEAKLSELDARWQHERGLVVEILELQQRIEAANPDQAELRSGFVQQLSRLRSQLSDLQGETPLVPSQVDGQTVAEVISAWTGVPVGRMVADEIQTVLDLPARLSERVLGQDHALNAIAARIRTSRAGIDNPARPVGVFLLVGPSGVGKTETALALAEALYGGERNLISINMSEYQEAHTVSSLKGSPPGYVGYGEGGVLTEAVRRRPHSVVLLDEVEKAHPDVMELFFQVFDKGLLEDGEGREIDFKNTVILLTSNVASESIMTLCADPDTIPQPAKLAEALRPKLLDVFPAALLGRMVTVAYYPILPAVLEKIVRLQLGRIVTRVEERHAVSMEIDEALHDAIVQRCTEPESGARNVDQILTHGLLPELSTRFLERMARRDPASRVRVGVAPGGGFSIDMQ